MPVKLPVLLPGSRATFRHVLDQAVDSLRSGSWVDRARLRRIALLLAVAYAASWAYLLSGEGRFDPLGRAIGADFAAFHGVSRALLDGSSAASLYSPHVLNEAIRDLTGGDASIVAPHPERNSPR